MPNKQTAEDKAALLQPGTFAPQITAAVVEGLKDTHEPTDAEHVHLAFAQLVEAHYIERAPPCDLPELRKPIHPQAQVCMLVTSQAGENV